MSGTDYAALIAQTQKNLSNATTTYGREPRHPFGACPKCRLNVCLAHHHCTR